MATVRIVGAADAAGVVQPAPPADVKKEGIKDAEKFFKHQLYLAGLRDELRGKVMEAGKATLQESVNLANELEVIHQDKRRGQVHAVTVNADHIGTTVETFSAHDSACLVAVGEVVAYAPHPMVCIKHADGSHSWWAAHLARPLDPGGTDG